MGNKQSANNAGSKHAYASDGDLSSAGSENTAATGPLQRAMETAATLAKAATERSKNENISSSITATTTTTISSTARENSNANDEARVNDDSTDSVDSMRAMTKEERELCAKFSIEAKAISNDLKDDLKVLERCVKMIDEHLQTRTYLVAERETEADVKMWEALLIASKDNGGFKREKYLDVSRWMQLMEQTNEAPAAIVSKNVVEELGKKVESLQVTGEEGEGEQKISKGQARKDAAKAAKKQAKEANKGKEASSGGVKKGPTLGSFEIDLKDAKEGAVCTRFPPEPSGFLHIGHAKAALLNQYFARRYKGTLILRFDDTNPDKEKQDFVDNILKDCATLGLDYDKLTYTSDSFPQLVKLGDKMMKEGKLYVDTTPVEKMREERLAKIDSQCRENSIAENVRLWEEMKKGSETGIECAVRIKADMQSNNGCMRDPVCFRCNIETPHHRTGTAFKVYPTYDFACPFVDAIEGVTHALRTSEYKDREEQYQFIQKAQGQREVHLWDYSRLNFTYTTLSKRKLQWFVDNNHAKSWDDPRFPTVQGVVRRGMRIEALKEFILSQGASRNNNTMEWDKIWAVNKRIIAPDTPMHVAINDEARVKVIFDNCGDEDKWVTKPRHTKNKDLGVNVVLRKKEVWIDQEDAQKLAENEEVTFTMWGNAFLKKIHKGSDGQIEKIDASLHLEGDVKTTKIKLNWLPAYDELVQLELHNFGYLITKRQPEDGDDFKDLVNMDSDKVTNCHGDCNLRMYQIGQVVELKNKGMYIIDKIGLDDGETPYVLFNIPDGKNA